MTPRSSSALPHRDGQHRPQRVDVHRIGVLGVGLGVVNVDRAPLEGRPSHRAVAAGREGVGLDEGLPFGTDVVGGHRVDQPTIEAPDGGVLGLAQPDRVLGQRLEDGLQIERGSTDHLEQLAGGCLLLERHAQFAVARLQLGEQADILDGDDRLVGKGLQ